MVFSIFLSQCRIFTPKMFIFYYASVDRSLEREYLDDLRLSAILFDLNTSNIQYQLTCHISLSIFIIMLSVEIVFILLLFVSLPNLFYRAEFNVPLLLFVAACWNNYKSTSAYLLLISWFLQLYRIIILVTYQDNATLNNQRQPFLIIITISAFVLKIFLIIYLIVKEEQFRNALKPSGILMNIYNSFLTKQPENQL